jgi:hypothetical protein
MISRLSRPDVVDMELDAQLASSSAALVSMATLEQAVPAAGEPGTECVLLGNAFNGNCIASFGDVDVPTKFWCVSRPKINSCPIQSRAVLDAVCKVSRIRNGRTFWFVPFSTQTTVSQRTAHNVGDLQNCIHYRTCCAANVNPNDCTYIQGPGHPDVHGAGRRQRTNHGDGPRTDTQWRGGGKR